MIFSLPGAPLPGWGIGDYRGDLGGARGKRESQGDDRRNSHSHQGYHREAKRYCVVQDYHQSICGHNAEASKVWLTINKFGLLSISLAYYQ